MTSTDRPLHAATPRMLIFTCYVNFYISLYSWCSLHFHIYSAKLVFVSMVVAQNTDSSSLIITSPFKFQQNLKEGKFDSLYSKDTVF
jgi:hypothetical protein